ncbi:class Ib ribonucleoside-diphosphate reductase assembly flavoprotein NrdI [Paeniglutamicibacter antarcticus]|uniref:Protein NrdI n=1 Tax=Arthrobacter terrae TaxID=2935737 RepID=A0A931CHG0_9MICC|nr:class Ib ribonucleoside-diphosphate reductase assembly flavoprotein NrdI [Arthrobacter terrae]
MLTVTGNLIYFSSVSDNTHRFVQKLGVPADRLPLHTSDDTLIATEPFVLVTPTYGGGPEGGAVPKQVIKFLNVETNRNLIRGVIAAGNTNFHDSYCIAGDVISAKCRTQLLYRVELMGTPEDVERVRTELEKFWKRTPSRLSA